MRHRSDLIRRRIRFRATRLLILFRSAGWRGGDRGGTRPLGRRWLHDARCALGFGQWFPRWRSGRGWLGFGHRRLLRRFDGKTDQLHLIGRKMNGGSPGEPEGPPDHRRRHDPVEDGGGDDHGPYAFPRPRHDALVYHEHRAIRRVRRHRTSASVAGSVIIPSRSIPACLMASITSMTVPYGTSRSARR